MASQAVRCPHCGAVQPDLENCEGELCLVLRLKTRITGYVCIICEKSIQWQRPQHKKGGTNERMEKNGSLGR